MRDVFRPGSFFDGLALAALCTASLALPALATRVDDGPGARLIVVFAPWTSERDAIQQVAAAGGALVRRGRWPFTVVAQFSDAGARHRIRSAGGWWTFEGSRLPGCRKPGSEA